VALGTLLIHAPRLSPSLPPIYIVEAGIDCSQSLQVAAVHSNHSPHIGCIPYDYSASPIVVYSYTRREHYTAPYPYSIEAN